MTTLPQTTPIRMPRPASSGASVNTPGMMIPQAPMQASGGGGNSLSMSDAWRVIRAHAWLLVVMICLSSVAGFFINNYLARYYSRYTATGTIEYQPTANYDPIRNPNPTIDSNSLALELLTQAQLLKQDALLTQVLTNPNSETRKTVWFHQYPNPESAKTDLTNLFVVTPIPNTRLVQVAVTTPIPSDSRTILEDVVTEHINEQRNLTQARQLERTTQLNKRKSDLENQLREKQTEIREKTVRLNAAGWDPVMGNADRHTAEQVLASNYAALTSELAVDQSRLDSLLDQLKRGETPTEVTSMLNTDPNIALWQNRVDDLDSQVRRSTMGEASQGRQRLVADRDDAAMKLESLRGEKKSELIDSEIGAMRSNLASKQQRLDNMKNDLEATKAEVVDLSNVYRQMLVARDEELSIRTDLKAVADGIEQANQVASMSHGGVDWSTRPTTPSVPSFPKLSATMTMAILAGVSLALGIAFLRELTDTSVRSPRDISRVGQLNLLGMVSDINDDIQSAGAKLPLVIFEAPHAILAEQFRQVRTRMQHSASLDSTRSILVTSPGPGDGKSTVACNLAAGLALNGRRILLVDANFRRPELHKVFNLTNDTGFSDVLNQLDTLPQNVRESQVPNLAVLTSGPKPVNATELFESQLLVDFIEKALEEFDHVVFDSGPLLVVSETVALAPRVDGVVTVVRARHNSRGLLVRMRDTLKQLKAEHLGVLLNGVRAQGGGYYGRNIKTYYAYQADGAVATETVVTSPTPAA